MVGQTTAWPSDARRDRLIGDWHIYQRTGGHRTSTDDLITAWYAVHRSSSTPARYLDLGCGVGSVLLMVTHELRPTFARGIEAQSESVEMARRAVTELPPHHGAIEIAHADFRETVGRTGRYELVTGSPPYFPLAAGVLPADPQKRACRFEVRGGVESYIEAAARVMSANGRFYVVFQSRWTSRVLDAAEAQGLRLGGRADFWAKAGDDLPFLSVFELSRRPADVPHHFACTVREADGSISPAYQGVREELGVAAVSG